MSQYPTEQFLLAISTLSIFLWISFLLLAWIAAKTWAWIDDKKGKVHNPVIALLMKLHGYDKYYEDYSDYGYMHPTEGRSDSSGAIIISLVIAALSPSIIYLSVVFYPVPIAIVILVLLAKLARYARRHKKAFDEHVLDKSAHK